MTWTQRPWMALAILAFAAGCAPPQDGGEAADEEAMAAGETMADMAAIEAEMDQLEADYIAFYNAGDAAGLAALWAPDGTQAPPLSESLDPAGIEATYAAQFAQGMQMELEVMREGMVVSDDMVAGWGGFAVTMTPEGGEPIVASGRYGVVMRQEPDGSWKIYRHMFNYEVPPPGFGMMEEAM